MEIIDKFLFTSISFLIFDQNYFVISDKMRDNRVGLNLHHTFINGSDMPRSAPLATYSKSTD